MDKIRKFVRIIRIIIKQITGYKVIRKLHNYQLHKATKNYPEENSNSINILNDDCLGHIFKFLDTAERVRLERGEYSTLHLYCISYRFRKIHIVIFYSTHAYVYTYICIFFFLLLQFANVGT